MSKYIDPFGRETFVEFMMSPWNKKLSLVVRKERGTIHESWDLETAKQIAMNLTKTIQKIEDEIECQSIK